MARECDEIENDRSDAVVDVDSWARFRKTLLNRDIKWRMEDTYTAKNNPAAAEGVTGDAGS